MSPGEELWGHFNAINDKQVLFSKESLPLTPPGDIQSRPFHGATSMMAFLQYRDVYDDSIDSEDSSKHNFASMKADKDDCHYIILMIFMIRVLQGQSSKLGISPEKWALYLREAGDHTREKVHCADLTSSLYYCRRDVMTCNPKMPSTILLFQQVLLLTLLFKGRAESRRQLCLKELVEEGDKDHNHVLSFSGKNLSDLS